MSKYTEGEWEAVGGQIKASGEHIITAWGLEGRVSEERKDGESWLEMRKRTDPDRVCAEIEGLANANLIAQAPAMHKELEKILTGLIDYPAIQRILDKVEGEV